jgi:SpoVK/Ycf46/Vps4 family AAA+-type ATPase
MEIGLPDERGRAQILKIHTRKMRENKTMAPDVDLNSIAARTKNFSGAELEGLVKSATSFALNRKIDSSEGEIFSQISISGVLDGNFTEYLHPISNISCHGN